MKLANLYDYETLLFLSSTKVFLSAGYDDYICPQFATWVELPEFDEEAEQCRFNKVSQSWLVEPKPIKVTAYHKQNRKPKEFDDKSLVTSEYSLKEPQTEWDEYIGGKWVTNQQSKYEAERAEVDSTRQHQYTMRVRPFLEEAEIKKHMGDLAEYERLMDLAVEERAKIQAEYPWPVAPEA